MHRSNWTTFEVHSNPDSASHMGLHSGKQPECTLPKCKHKNCLHRTILHYMLSSLSPATSQCFLGTTSSSLPSVCPQLFCMATSPVSAPSAATHLAVMWLALGGIAPSSRRELPPHQASCKQQRVLSQPPVGSRWSVYKGWASWALKLYHGLVPFSWFKKKIIYTLKWGWGGLIKYNYLLVIILVLPPPSNIHTPFLRALQWSLRLPVSCKLPIYHLEASGLLLYKGQPSMYFFLAN